MAIVYVNGGAYKDAGSSTTAATPAFNASANNCIVVFVCNYTSGAPVLTSGVTDTAGNTYTKCGSTESNADWRADCWVAYNILGNANNVVTATYASAANNRGITAVQYENILTTGNPYDTGAANSITTTGADPATSSSTSTTAYADEVVIGWFVTWASVGLPTNYGDANGCTMRIIGYVATDPNTGLCDRIVSSTGSYSISMDIVGGSDYQFVNFVRTFRGADAGGGMTLKLLAQDLGGNFSN